MYYMVVRKGQLVEHTDNREAQQEAERLSEKYGDQFYVVEAKTITQAKVKTTYETVDLNGAFVISMKHAALLAKLLEGETSRVGEYWSKEEDELLTAMWKTDDYRICDLAVIFRRNPIGIEYRLKKNHIYF